MGATRTGKLLDTPEWNEAREEWGYGDTIHVPGEPESEEEVEVDQPPSVQARCLRVPAQPLIVHAPVVNPPPVLRLGVARG